MPIQVKCANPDCAKALRVNDELAGKTIRCPACKTPIKLPGSIAPAMVAAAPKPTAAAAPKPAPKAPPAPPPPPPTKKPAPAPMPPKTAPKARTPDEDVPTLEGFDDFDEVPAAKNKVTN